MFENSIQTFLYFAYGSNLLAHRIHLLNPTAVRRGIGKLNDYKLNFDGFSLNWGGCSATIVPDPGKHVWGAIWEIEKSQMGNLDKQEGVSQNIYFPLQVKVLTPENETLDCRVYKMVGDVELYASPDLLPEDRRPSRVYLETILQGAVESNLPDEYIKFLKSFPHNGFSGPVSVPGLNISFVHTNVKFGIDKGQPINQSNNEIAFGISRMQLKRLTAAFIEMSRNEDDLDVGKQNK